MNLLNWVRERLGLSPATAGRSHDQGPRPVADFYEFEAHMEGDRVHVRLEGEIDIITAGEVQKQLLQALDLGPGSVHFDLRGVSFMDMSGLTLMSRVAKRLNSEKRPVSCATNQRMASIFRMCDLAPLLNVTMEE